MAPKYRKIDPRIWRDERFASLTVYQKAIALYCLTAQANRCGIFVFSIGMAAEEIGADLGGKVGGKVPPNLPGTFREEFLKVVSTLRWEWDESRRVLYFPTWWKYNPPEGENVLTGCMTDLADLPETPLLARFYANVAYLPPKLHRRFREGSPQPSPQGSPKPSPTQEQEQEQEQDSKKGATVRPSLDLQKPQKEPAEVKPEQKPATVPIPPAINTPAFRKAWADWIADRRARKIKKYSEDGARRQLAHLAAMGEDAAIRAIEFSIANQYQGIFPPKDADAKPAGGFKTAREKEADHVGQMFNDAFEGDL